MDSQLQEFEKGHAAFQKVKFNQSKERFKKLVAEGQSPKALFIGCSDSRVMPAMITGSNPGDLFIIRNIGNFVAPYKPDADFHATASAIEYATSILEVSDIIVCGHSHCGAIEALYKDIEETSENTHTIKWLEFVVYQLGNLLTYPGVKRRVEEGTLFLHGWHYHMEHGDIEYYDDENYEFKPLSQK